MAEDVRYDMAETERLLDEFLDGKVDPVLTRESTRAEALKVVQAFVSGAEALGYMTMSWNNGGSTWLGIAHRSEQALIQISPQGEISVAEPVDSGHLGAPGRTIGQAQIVKLRMNRTTHALEVPGTRDPDTPPRSPVALLAETVLRVMRSRAQRT